MTQALELTEYLILKLLGSLDDLSLDLSNTVVNVYHDTITHALEESMTGGQEVPDRTGPGDLPDMEEIILILGLLSPHESNRILLMNRMINSLREIKRTESRRAANYIAQLITDSMKYCIEDAPKKSEVRRWIERRQKKKTVREVPGLVDRINVRNQS
ncbi:MAG: hypothetical protein V1793_17615 [Pseudomonadota bacterium]